MELLMNLRGHDDGNKRLTSVGYLSTESSMRHRRKKIIQRKEKKTKSDVKNKYHGMPSDGEEWLVGALPTKLLLLLRLLLELGERIMTPWRASLLYPQLPCLLPVPERTDVSKRVDTVVGALGKQVRKLRVLLVCTARLPRARC